MSATFNNPANIDPELRAPYVDPHEQLLNSLRSSPAAPPPPAASNAGNEDRDDADMRLDSVALSASRPGSSLAAFGSLVKGQVKLSDKSVVAFDQYCQNRSAEERGVILFAHVLELLDIAKKNEKAELWTISSDLSKKINSYTQAFVYSPELVAYRGLNIAGHLMNAMRESRVKNLPPDGETAQCDLVLSKTRDKGTHFRNILKTAVVTSAAPGSETANVAALANKLLQQSKIKPTLQFYVRLAFIRWVWRSYPWVPDDFFWMMVDQCIEKNSRNCSTKEELDALYNSVYQTDIELYGDPATTPHQTSEFDPSSSTWQAVVRKHSKLVRPDPKNAKVLEAAEAAAARPAPATKRRRVEMDGEDDDDMGGTGSGSGSGSSSGSGSGTGSG
ncbi:hypothetical protein DFH06DRAFT_1465695 [Mycena polygramma]|nr:hypothetical protein DFH06DRAFT_1465695 [Mycena polygramma]